MSTTGTRTTTYTTADIRKVVENFAADLSMIGQATGLRSRENIRGVVADLNVFADHKYLVEVTLLLKDASGNKIQGAIYKVSEAAAGWKSEAPGNNLWPATPGGSLVIIATMTAAWFAKTDKEAFIKQQGLTGSWPQSDEDTSMSGMTSSSGQKYASSNYGWERTNYSK